MKTRKARQKRTPLMPQPVSELTTGFPLSTGDDIAFDQSSLLYLLRRRFQRAFNALVRETVGRDVPSYIVLTNPKSNDLLFSSPADNAFCREMQHNPEGHQRCADCYRTHLLKTTTQHEPITYKCHAGLTNVLVPIRARHNTVGGFVIGRALGDTNADEQRKKIAATAQKLRDDSLSKAIGKAPTIPERELMLAALVAWNLLDTEGPTVLHDQIFNARHLSETVPSPHEPPAEPMTSEQASALRRMRLCQRTIAILKTHYASPLTVERVARAVGITPNYLSTIFHKTVGTTVGNYLTQVRIKKSQALLQNTDVNVKEVAYRVGYTDSNHFSIAFRKITGFTPKEWRAKVDEQILADRLLPPSQPPASVTDAHV